ncbi:hypothetical protein A0J57_09135 [Sphingobium sp. 22B]|nr:hypothetical protein A0J57_09135 [Sphingobium sp. 22B]OAP31662.1 hypothetical protein A8O16_12590 [Sphingobium sp. 20006FA]
MTAVVALSAAFIAAPGSQAQEAAASTEAQDSATPNGASDIIVTATRRASRLADVPVAVSAISPQTLQNSGVSDIRQLTQVAPSLLVSSNASEAGAGGARIRGVGTVGDNAGLEASVATFVDGVYRSRAGVALNEFGQIAQIEVLRGPQGTLFGRNASAGLINITTAAPESRLGGYVEGSYGNYDYYRLAAGITGPIAEGLDARLDAAYTKRDGFLKDVISGRRINDRDRYLLRGKLRYEPNDDLTVMLIGDYSRQNEECCSGNYRLAVDRTKQADGSYIATPSSLAAIQRSIVSAVPGAGNGIIIDDTFSRKVAVTPGRTFRSDVRDWGLSGQIDWDLGGAKLTSITAYRYNKYIGGQDSDVNNLDIIYRPDDGSRFNRFKTFSQELRLQGSAFNDRLDWLVGGYFAHEELSVGDNITYGADYDRYGTLVGAAGLGAVNPALGSLFASTGFSNLSGFAQGFAAAQLAALPPAQRDAIAATVAGQVQNLALAGKGQRDRYDQTDDNFAIFTHNIIRVTDRLSLTLGARHTWDNKKLDAALSSNSPCPTYNDNITRLRALAASGSLGAASPVASALANSVLAPLSALTCVVNPVNGEFSGKRREREWTGTVVLSYKPTDRLMVYASASRGYKAGGFNLDRSPFYDSPTRTLVPTDNLNNLQFEPEKVDAFELGGKYRGIGFDLNVAAFYQRFDSFQLNTFNGVAFVVSNVRGCKDDLGTTDSDAIAGNSACADTKPGVTSKGIEIEASIHPVQDFTASAGLTLTDTRYAKDLVGSADRSGNNSLPPLLSLLPGSRLSLSSQYTITGSAQWTPPVGKLRGLLYADFRYMSEFRSGSDLFVEKEQPGFLVVNARVGIGADDGNWSLEAWARNAFNEKYVQSIFNATLQGSNNSIAQLAAGQRTTQLFATFLAEPRTFGVTARKRF